jgi:UDP-N-acetyl-2-amino-2-deoxyglucuronate dehydrogenase
MRVGIIGTGAVSHKHAAAYRSIGYEFAACSDIDSTRARLFAEKYGGEPVERWQEVCRHPKVDFVDVCTFPDFRLEAVELCAITKKHVQVQKPIATKIAIGRQMVATARSAGILLNVVSQHRFDEASRFLKTAIEAGRLGKIIEADAYVKWYRPAEYYSRSIKGSWMVEGGGALINQGIHQVDLLLWLVGRVNHVTAEWHLGALHHIESEDVVSALLKYASGAHGVIQASTAIFPGYPERLEIHGAKGTAILTGDRMTAWDVKDDSGEPPPMGGDVATGASDPMAVSLQPFERQFRDFGEAIQSGRAPLVSGEEGCHALQLVEAIYRSCRHGQRISLNI